MLSNTCEGVGSDPGRAGEDPVEETQSNGHRGARHGQDRRGSAVQEWSDGSRYEGEFVNGFKHGTGRYAWRTGEYYEGSFYKDYRHGDGLYCWPTGHKFFGKFYLNRKEGYGQQLFPDGTVFQGLYHADQRFGPGVVTYPDGCQDVGLWLRERLVRLCTSVEAGFSLKIFPEYAAYMETAANSLTLPVILSGALQTHSVMSTDRALLSDEDFILPPGIESYSTDGDHLPLPPGRRRDLDRHFYGELWESDAYLHQGYERDPLSTLPLQARMQTHIHKHRLQTENIGWDVAAVLSLSREGFGPKGPLEVTSELLIQHASRGELPAVSKILQTGLVHPDIADSRGHTALIAATVNCHNDIIQLLLNMGADIDKLNCEGMSALAVCHVLYYPFHSLHTILTEPPTKTQLFESACGNSPQNSQGAGSADTLGLNNRPQSTNSNQTNPSCLSDQTHEELTKHISHHSCEVADDSELITEQWADLSEAEAPTNTAHLQEEEREEDSKGTETEGEIQEGSQKEDEGEEKKVMEQHGQTGKNGKDVVRGQERTVESQNEDVKLREEDGEGVDEQVREIQKECEGQREERGNEKVPGVERSIQVLDGHITLGSVQWKECRPVGRIQGNQNFDSARSVSSYKIQVTEEVMQRSAEALSRTGFPLSSDTQETVRKMAAMKIEHRVRLNTLNLLLQRGADPNIPKVPMPVLFLAVMAADTEAVRQLLLCGARTDIPLPPERKGLYPLHVAASLPGPAGPIITELLLHTITDTDARACDQDEVYKPDNISINTQEPVGTNDNLDLKEGGRTALHVACQRDSDYKNASKVVALLLSHRASTDLLWSGHSPLSLAIASGNDLAVEELLKGGADPNIPLGSRVGSALCALANINYHLGGNRTKLLDVLAKAGADILMPVKVGDVVGTAVDYAHYSFSQDVHIANTPFHALNMRKRKIFKGRRQLLSMMGDLLRQTAGQREAEYLQREEEHLKSIALSSDSSLPSCESLQHITQKRRKPVFRFCYHCGRSVSVKLTPCSRCHKVYYCSRSCTLKAWDERHKEECVRVSASADGIQKSVVFKSQRGPKPITVTLKPKTVPRPLSGRLISQRVPKPSRMAEKVSESQLDPKENYSLN